MPNIRVPVHSPLAIQGLKLRAVWSSSYNHESRKASGYSLSASLARPAASAAAAASAASMPLLIAAWLPLMREATSMPASSPISAPPGKSSLGMDCRPPAANARAP